MNAKFGEGTKIPYKLFETKLHISHATVSRYIGELETDGHIEILGQSRYKIKSEFFTSDYLIIDEFLLTNVWDIEKKLKGGKRKAVSKNLSNTAVFVLELLIRFYRKKENKNKLFVSSQNRIGKALNIPGTTAGDAIYELMSAGLLYRNAYVLVNPNEELDENETVYAMDKGQVKLIEGKGANGSALSAFTVPRELLNVSRKEEEIENVAQPAPEPTKPKSEKRKKSKKSKLWNGSELRAEIERHYFNLRHEAEQRAEATLANALSDEEYGKIHKEVSELGRKLAFALLDDKVQASKLSEQIVELKARGNKRLSELYIDKDDFEPRYKCRQCNDTGYTSNGAQCACLKEFIAGLKGKK